jgi:hypothetical protein
MLSIEKPEMFAVWWYAEWATGYLDFSPKLTLVYELNEQSSTWFPSDCNEQFLTARHSGNRAFVQYPPAVAFGADGMEWSKPSCRITRWFCFLDGLRDGDPASALIAIACWSPKSARRDLQP